MSHFILKCAYLILHFEKFAFVQCIVLYSMVNMHFRQMNICKCKPKHSICILTLFYYALVSRVHENTVVPALHKLLQRDGFFWELWYKCQHHSSLPWQHDRRIGYPLPVTDCSLNPLQLLKVTCINVGKSLLHSLVTFTNLPK